MDADQPPGPPERSAISVPELRDYHQINAELVRRLNLGIKCVVLQGVEGQRLLLAGLAGPWKAVVEVDGNAGPELAAELDAPGLTVVCRGSAADGAARELRSGRVLILGTAGLAAGYFQRGGLIVAASDVGPRAGLCQQGGDLVLLGRAGPLTGERQSAGRLFVNLDRAGPHLGFGARGGDVVELGPLGPIADRLDHSAREVIRSALELVERYGASGSL